MHTYIVNENVKELCFVVSIDIHECIIVVHACILANIFKWGDTSVINRKKCPFFSSFGLFFFILEKVNIHIYITNIRHSIEDGNLIVKM